MKHPFISLLLCTAAALCGATMPAVAQSNQEGAAPAIHVIYMGGSDCPPCVAWRALELPKLQATEVFKRIKFSYVVKTIKSAVPAAFFLPQEVKPFKNKLDDASNGTTGSPQTALIVDGEIFHYRFGTFNAESFEQILLAIEKRQPLPIKRCLKLTKSRQCETVAD